MPEKLSKKCPHDNKNNKMFRGAVRELALGEFMWEVVTIHPL